MKEVCGDGSWRVSRWVSVDFARRLAGFLFKTYQRYDYSYSEYAFASGKTLIDLVEERLLSVPARGRTCVGCMTCKTSPGATFGEFE